MILRRWIRRWKKIIITLLASVGLFWTLIELFSYYLPNVFLLNDIRVLYLIWVISIIISIFKNIPRKKFTSKLRSKDVYLEVKVGNIFKNKGAIILPINDHLDCQLNGNVSSSNSLMNQFVNKYYGGDCANIDQKCKVKLTEKKLSTPLDIGTVFEIKEDEKTFFFVVNSKKGGNSRVHSTLDDFVLSLSELWQYIAKDAGRYDYISIPLLNTGHGRITDLNRETAIKEIINSFVEACKHYDVCDHLIISLSQNSVDKWDIDLDNIEGYLSAQCKYYRDIKFSDKQIGQEISESKIKELNL